MIFKVTTRHAICAAVYLAEHGADRVVTAREIARKRKIPPSYLPRILSKMAKHGIVRSFHGGKDKGYMMVRDIGSISLFEILDVFEGWSEEGCLLRPRDDDCDCPAKSCWKVIEQRMFMPLKRATLGGLFNRGREPDPGRLRPSFFSSPR